MSTLVFDNGSGFIKAGFSGEDTPKVVFPTIVGAGADKKDYFVGSQAQAKRDALSVTRPIQRGCVKSWDDLEKIWDHTYTELKAAPDEHPILLTETPLMPTADREKMVEIMFETFKVPSMSLGVDAVLSLYAAGRLEGVVLGSGYGVTYVVPCTKGFIIPSSVLRLDLGGSDLTNYLSKILTERGYSTEQDIARDIKEKLCYVTTNYEREVKKPKSSIEKSYELPDGKTITVGNELFQCPEALFNPQLAGVESSGIHKQIFDAITKSDAGLHGSLYKNIVVSGGNTVFEGLPDRLQTELEGLVPRGQEVKIIAPPTSHPPTRQNSVWIGGSILTALPTFKDILISKKAYQETGPSIAKRIE